jgi:hypothetical protein
MLLLPMPRHSRLLALTSLAMACGSRGPYRVPFRVPCRRLRGMIPIGSLFGYCNVHRWHLWRHSIGQHVARVHEPLWSSFADFVDWFRTYDRIWSPEVTSAGHCTTRHSRHVCAELAELMGRGRARPRQWRTFHHLRRAPARTRIVRSSAHLPYASSIPEAEARTRDTRDGEQVHWHRRRLFIPTSALA